MIPVAILPVIRRSILDLMNDIGGEHNDDTLSMLLNELGHRVARRDVAGELAWLALERLIKAEVLGPYTVARILPDGRDVAEGRLLVEGIYKFKTGE